MSGYRSLVIVPAFNEQSTIKEVVAQVMASNYEVLVVDDASTDETADLAALAGAPVLRLAVNLGVGGALRAGFRYAIDHGYDSVVQIDGDGQHPTHQIADLEHAARTFDAHLVIGSRFLSPDATLVPSPTRRLSMWILSRFMTQLAGFPFTDTTSGFRLIRQPLLLRFADEFPDYYLGDTFEATATAIQAGYRVVEIPAALSPRRFGNSSSSTTDSILSIFKVIVTTLLNFRRRNLQRK